MFMPGKLKWVILTCLSFAVMSGAVFAQKATTPTAKPPEEFPQEKLREVSRRPAGTSAPTRIIVAGQSETNAPQVVTVVHQLSVLKILSLLLRQRGDKDAVALMSQPLPATDVHTNIIAGLAFDDGQTIAVWLPQATEEISGPVMPPEILSQFPETARPMAMAATSAPNLSVVLADGKRLRVRYVGLDGATGISVLRANLAGGSLVTRDSGDKLIEGERIRLVAPQRSEAPANLPARTIYVRIGEKEVKLSQIRRTSAGSIERFIVTAANLSPAFVGGIALNSSGQTVGIVEEIEGDRAQIVPASVIDAAVRRVLDRQASVPRPLLGVRGEPADLMSRASFLAYGWSEQNLSKFFAKPSGMFVTSVLPGTPAALANLHPGDVIVRVNEGDVKSVDDFSFMLGQAGSGAPVQFTVVTPNHPTPESLTVKLGGSFQSDVQKQFFTDFAFSFDGPLASLGIETVAVNTRFAPEVKAQDGLLVIAVRAQSPAARGGVREGDIIESIDGRAAARATTIRPQIGSEKKHILGLLRERQRLEVVLEPVTPKGP